MNFGECLAFGETKNRVDCDLAMDWVDTWDSKNHQNDWCCAAFRDLLGWAFEPLSMDCLLQGYGGLMVVNLRGLMRCSIGFVCQNRTHFRSLCSIPTFLDYSIHMGCSRNSIHRDYSMSSNRMGFPMNSSCRGCSTNSNRKDFPKSSSRMDCSMCSNPKSFPWNTCPGSSLNLHSGSKSKGR